MILGVPVVMLLGIVDFSATALKFAVLFVGITVLGNQLGLNAVLGHHIFFWFTAGFG